jgi:hypothetical protein
MLAEYKAKTNIGVGVGLMVQILGRTMSGAGGALGLMGWLVTLAGLGLFLWGCFSYAKGKGYHPALGLLGLLSCIGLLVLVVLPDKYK